MSGHLDGLHEVIHRLLDADDGGRVPAFVAHVDRDLAVLGGQDVAQRVVDVPADDHRLAERFGAHGEDADLLEVQVVGREPSAVDVVEKRHGKHVRVHVEVAVQRKVAAVGARPGDGHRDADDRVSADPFLVGRPVEPDHREVDVLLIPDVHPDERGGDHLMDVPDRLLDAETAEGLRVLVPDLPGFLLSARAARRNVGAAPDVVPRPHVHLYGRIEPAIQNFPGHDLRDFEPVFPQIHFRHLLRFSKKRIGNMSMSKKPYARLPDQSTAPSMRSILT